MAAEERGDRPWRGWLAIGGFMGVGKSTVGPLVAARLGAAFVDLDALIEERSGRSIVELFAEEGEAAFRALELEALESIRGRAGLVVSLGGGTLHQERCRVSLEGATVVVLSAPFAHIAPRLTDDGRPLADDRVHQRFLQRQPGYARAGRQVSALGSPAQIADRVIEVVQRAADPGRAAPEIERLTVDLGLRSYEVVAAPTLRGLGDALRALRLDRILVVTNPVVGRLWLDPLFTELQRAGVAARALMVPDGERHKTLTTWARLVDEVLALRPDRGTALLALGGGVTGDLTGYAAASVMRGLPFVQVPTSLLAMVDSAVGGKTGVNTPLGKNLVGAFHQPRLVWAALETLETLPAVELRAGLAEGVKHGFIADAEMWSACEARRAALASGEPRALAWLVLEACRIKAAIVAEDERESGRRAVLNFGHTVGHAIETVAGTGSLRHGTCVALGMLAEARAAVAAGGLDAHAGERLQQLLLELGLPDRAPALSRASLIDASRMDKKRARGNVTVPVPVRIGTAELRALDESQVASLFDHLPLSRAVLEA